MRNATEVLVDENLCVECISSTNKMEENFMVNKMLNLNNQNTYFKFKSIKTSRHPCESRKDFSFEKIFK